jgi:hypothetical protein
MLASARQQAGMIRIKTIRCIRYEICSIRILFSMETEYYCKKCDARFLEKRIPNLNKIHKRCGERARVILYIEKKYTEEA